MRPIVLGLGAAAAVAASLITVTACNAPDTMQLLMVFLFPPLAGIASGAATLAVRPASPGTGVVAIAVGVVVAVGTVLLTLLLWLAHCSA